MLRALPFSALLAAIAGAAFAQGTDFLTAPRIACTPERVTECKAANDCTVTPASARDKQEVLTVNFAGKSVLLRDKGKDKKFAVIDSDTLEGDVRRVVIRQEGSGNEKRSFTVSRSGVLTLIERDGKLKSEAMCKAAPAAG